jgi:hypothetical protein
MDGRAGDSNQSSVVGIPTIAARPSTTTMPIQMRGRVRSSRGAEASRDETRGGDGLQDLLGPEPVQQAEQHDAAEACADELGGVDACRTRAKGEFLRPQDRHATYENRPLLIEFGQTISQPYIDHSRHGACVEFASDQERSRQPQVVERANCGAHL